MSKQLLVKTMLLALVIGASSAVAAPAPAPEQRPQGWSDQSYYLAMRDGVRLAVSVWLPPADQRAKRIPVVLIQTRYGRAGVFNYGENRQYPRLLRAGYAVAIVDTRGTTSSFGSRDVEIGPKEVADMDTLIRHFRTRSWSSGEIIATGVSYMADTADIASGSAAGLVATVVRQSDFDAYLDLFNPGGVANDGMMNIWGGDTLLRDHGRSSNPADGFDCGLRAPDCARLWPRLQPVDGDAQFVLLRKALASRKHHWQPDDYRQVEFRDDRALNGYTVHQSSPVAYLDALRRQRTPAQYWGSWMDAGTADAALSRFNSLPSVPMEVWITAHTHANDQLTDPFLPMEKAPIPSVDEQWATMIGFADRARGRRATDRLVHYYVLGSKAMKTTTAWPPVDARASIFHFGPGNALVSSHVATEPGRDTYAVDFDATTGSATRWSTQMGTPAAYADRAEADRRLLTYTSEPWPTDMELVGSSQVTLYVTTTSKDPAFFAYLEDVAPDGRSTYLTEGMLRAVHRRDARPVDLTYVQAAPAKSFLRKDALPMVPGVVTEVSFPLFPVAALLRAGHRLRLSLAGADRSVFRRYSDDGSETWIVERSAASPSALTVPLRPWHPAQ